MNFALSLLLTLLALLSVPGPGLAQERPDGLLSASETAELASRLDQVEKGLAGTQDTDALHGWAAEVGQTRYRATRCVATAETRLAGIEESLKTLGDKVAGEDLAVTRKRAQLLSDKAARTKQLANCRLLVLRSEEVLAALTARADAIVARHLLARGPSISVLLRENWQRAGEWLTATWVFVTRHSGIRGIAPGGWLAIVVTALIAGGLGVGLRRRLRGRVVAATAATGFAGALSGALLSVAARYGPHLLISSSVALMVWFFSGDLETRPFVALVAYGLPVYFLLAAAVQLFLAPAPAEPFLPIDREVARAVARRLKVLAFLFYLGYLLFSTLLWQSLPEPALLLSRGAFAAVLVPNLIWAIWLFRRLVGIDELNVLRAAVSVALVAALAAEWLGYRNLSLFLLGGVIGTMLSVGIGLLVGRLFRELYEGLDSGRGRRYTQLRQWFGVAPQTPFPGLTWIRFLTTLGIWAAVLLGALRAWGISEGVLQTVRSFMTEGFAIGSLQVVPSRILMALLIIAALLPVSRWVRTRMEMRWLRKTYLDRGAREALVTVSGYTVVGLAVLFALSVAGMDFSNLALIAGALSVGIGFGLQNVVNNFVSGLILLFERPVKTGDWVVVGNTEGYVRRISIRSTQIQTFDRADVIVPNSELVSSQVTNWMLRDPYGRLVVPVGVAYGSDTEQVKAALLEVARGHPQVLTEDPRMPPTVLFRRFGDSSLDFELRCFVANIDNRLTVISDLNFAIDAAFRRYGIEIPFPQRDVHMK